MDFGRHLLKVGSDQVVGQDILEEREPEDTNLCKELALVGDTL